jgi:hypothetical protein
MVVTSAKFFGRSPPWCETSWAIADQTIEFFGYSLTPLPTNGFPLYNLGWSSQHEMAFYLLAAVVTPRFGLFGAFAVLISGVIVDHLLTLPWYLHQYFSYYGNFLAGTTAFLVFGYARRLGFLLPVEAGTVALYFAPSPDFYPLGLFCWLVMVLSCSLRVIKPRAGSNWEDCLSNVPV